MTKYSQGQILILQDEQSHILQNAVNKFINNSGIIARDIQYRMSSSMVEGYSPIVIHSVCIVFDSYLTDGVIEQLKQEAIKTIYYKEV